MKTRWRITALACAMGASLGLAAPAAAQGGGRFIPTGGFSGIDLTGPDGLRFTTGPRAGVIARAADIAPGDVAALVRGGTLRIASGRRLDLVAATAPMLRAVAVNGTGDLDIGPISSPSFEGIIRGPGRLLIASLRAPQARLVNDGVGDLVVRAVDAGTLVIEIHGPGDVRIVGKARSVSITAFGSGDCDARGLSTRDLAVTVAGSGNVQANSSGVARIAASGSGDVVVNGRPQCTVRASGVGEVVCG